MAANDQSLLSPLRHAVDPALLSGARVALKVVLSHLQQALGRMVVQNDPDLFELNLFVCTLQLVLKRARALSKSTKPQY
ncbi:MAG: hypothetical protein C0473_00245 [Cyanobacteria bacterium DS3.002]|nr:hypothetical protein [Cyanobacteria bacterium DS3.002]MBA4049414.1 hypothetical protein [Cyanobacteria bacterium DS2.008]MBA4078211.1 hypothetical protein [Cyanobacteria bacterium PR.023]